MNARRDHISFETASEEETVALAERLAGALRPGDVLALEGDLGAGKTRFVRGLARGLGHDPRLVSSPTYVLMHEYATNPDAPALIHIDAYRVGSGDELEGMGIDRALSGGAVLAVEWASRVAEALPADRLGVEIEHRGDDRRSVTLRWGAAGGAWAERLSAF